MKKSIREEPSMDFKCQGVDPSQLRYTHSVASTYKNPRPAAGPPATQQNRDKTKKQEPVKPSSSQTPREFTPKPPEKTGTGLSLSSIKGLVGGKEKQQKEEEERKKQEEARRKRLERERAELKQKGKEIEREREWLTDRAAAPAIKAEAQRREKLIAAERDAQNALQKRARDRNSQRDKLTDQISASSSSR